MSSNILIIYPYFPPAKRAGGIASSLSNMVALLKNHQLYVYTSCYDLDGSVIGISHMDEWLTYSNNCQVFYASNIHNPNFLSIVTELNIKVVYLNGLYGNKFAIKPLRQLGTWRKDRTNKFIVAPRGMVQKNSLKIKPLKKILYFALMKSIGAFKNVTFHVTEPQEYEDTARFFNTQNVVMVKDCPNITLNLLTKGTFRQDGTIKLLFLSLLARMKNLTFLLELMNSVKEHPIVLDIYGPIKDEAYWNECLLLMKNLPNVRYCGEVTPKEVTHKMNEYDFFVLPTLGENFGHVIFESLVAGTPIIISDKTSWQNIDSSSVGWAIPLEERLWIERLKSLATIKNEEYMAMNKNCHQYIENYLAENNPVKEYEELFGS